MQNISSDAKAIVLAGILAAIAFFGVLSLGLGSFFLFLPTLPLFYVGLSLGSRISTAGAMVATCIIGVIGKAAVASVFLLIIALPACYFIHASLLARRRADGTREWLPLGRALLNLTLAASAFLALLTFFLAFQPENLPQILTGYVRTALEPLKAEFGPSIEDLAVGWLFLPMAVTFWVWGLSIYAHAWLAGRMLAGKRLAIRPDMAITPFAIPSWMLSLLGICALGSLIGGESAQFLGKTLMIVLALPYFFEGIASLHQLSAKWPNRKIFLFIIYLLIMLLFWPALFISGVGLWRQIKALNKGLPQA